MKNSIKIYELEQLEKTGIYKITCTVNNKVYVGSACGTSKSIKKRGFYRRWKEHARKLKQGTHRNKYLQFSWNKYGEDAFVFEILEYCDRETAKNREVFYIDLYKSRIEDGGFNILNGHLANYNKFTEEHKQKISISLKGRSRPLEVVKKWSNKVQQIDTNGNLVAEYYSMSEAERATGIMRQDIGQACIGKKMKKAGGYFWKKVEDIV